VQIDYVTVYYDRKLNLNKSECFAYEVNIDTQKIKKKVKT